MSRFFMVHCVDSPAFATVIALCKYSEAAGSNKCNTSYTLGIPEEMHENVVSISHTPELFLWSFQNNSQNSDTPSTVHPSESTMQW